MTKYQQDLILLKRMTGKFLAIERPGYHTYNEHTSQGYYRKARHIHKASPFTFLEVTKTTASGLGSDELEYRFPIRDWTFREKT